MTSQSQLLKAVMECNKNNGNQILSKPTTKAEEALSWHGTLLSGQSLGWSAEISIGPFNKVNFVRGKRHWIESKCLNTWQLRSNTSAFGQHVKVAQMFNVPGQARQHLQTKEKISRLVSLVRIQNSNNYIDVLWTDEDNQFAPVGRLKAFYFHQIVLQL